MKTLLQALGASALSGAILPTLLALVWVFSIGSFDIVEALQNWFVASTNAVIIGLTFVSVGLIKGNAI